MKPEGSPYQRCFPWIPEGVVLSPSRRKVRRSRIRPQKWPPRIGQKIAFKTDSGVEIGVLQQIRQGLVCLDFIMTNGKVAMEHDLVMTEPHSWRDPDSVSEEERRACIDRVQAAHNANPNKDLRQDPLAWSDFCQYTGFTMLRTARERERKMLALMDAAPAIRPN